MFDEIKIYKRKCASFWTTLYVVLWKSRSFDVHIKGDG